MPTIGGYPNYPRPSTGGNLVVDAGLGRGGEGGAVVHPNLTGRHKLKEGGVEGERKRLAQTDHWRENCVLNLSAKSRKSATLSR